MLVMSLFTLAFLITYLPYENKVDNFLEIMNESFVYVAICHFIVFSDAFSDIKMKYSVGWSLDLIVSI